MAPMEQINSNSDKSEISTELAARRTGLSFQRTRMSADRTLMSVMRTALSLIGFGFTIFQFFEKLKGDSVISHDKAPRNFGMSLVFLGVGMLVLGIIYHLQFMLGLRKERGNLTANELIHGESDFPVSFTLIIAVLILILGGTAIISMAFHIGPFN
jgi:putative membrane protein